MVLICRKFTRAMSKKKLVAICGSISAHSANLSILQYLSELFSDKLEFEIYSELSLLPHFNPDLDKENAPPIVEALRTKVKNADGVLICTPEYVFSLPGVLKNALEWSVSTTVFFEKPVTLITASASGVKAHESLQLIMETIGADLRKDTQLLIQGAKGKVKSNGEISDEGTIQKLKDLAVAFQSHLYDKAKS
jgi:NAD(P)H-dependent FMN reductase